MHSNDTNMIWKLQNIVYVPSNVPANVTDHNLHWKRLHFSKKYKTLLAQHDFIKIEVADTNKIPRKLVSVRKLVSLKPVHKGQIFSVLIYCHWH